MQQEALSEKGIIAWTRNKLYGDTYVITFVACPGFKPKYPIAGLNEPSIDKVTKAKIIKRGGIYETRELFGYQWMVNIENPQVIIEDVEFFEELRNYISMAARTVQKKQDLIHYARRLTDKNDIFAKHADKYYKIPVHMRAWYVEAAFYEDIAAENDAMITFRRANLTQIALHNKLTADLSHKADTTSAKIARNFNAIKNTANDISASVGHVASLTGVDYILGDIGDGLLKAPLMQMIADSNFADTVAQLKANVVLELSEDRYPNKVIKEKIDKPAKVTETPPG
jgi:hypothetical protein